MKLSSYIPGEGIVRGEGEGIGVPVTSNSLVPGKDGKSMIALLSG